jgi:aminoglycoside phosphotransferase (APT) family kinase protein
MRVLNARVLNVAALVQEIFRKEPALPASVDSVRFIQRHYSEVYRVEAADRRYIVHVTPDSSEYLQRVRGNLVRLDSLNEPGIPHVVGWREESWDLDGGGSRWALLVCTEIPGSELSPKTYSPKAWNTLRRLLQRVHAMPGEKADAVSAGHIHQPESFEDFASSLLLRLAGFPLGQDRVRRHLDAMGQYLHDHQGKFRIPPRLIHGDLNRSNVLVDDDRVGIIDWSELAAGDYAYDLSMLKFMMDSVASRHSTELLRQQVREYRDHFGDDTMEVRMRFFLALSGLVHAFWYASQSSLFPAARTWRVRTCYLHSEAQWAAPLRLDGFPTGAPASRTEHWPLGMPQPLRGVFYLVAPKRVA